MRARGQNYGAAVDTFRYQAVDSEGQSRHATIEAETLHDAVAQLRVAEINVVSIDGSDSAPRRFEPQGLRPSPAPRYIRIRISDVPAGTALVFGGALFTGVALIFIAVGITLLASGEAQGFFFVLFPMIHLAAGLAMLAHVLRRRSRRQHIYCHGDVAMAEITGVGYNRSVRVNGRNPFELAWSFDLDGHRYHDKLSTFDENAMTFVPGDRLWVLYDPADPEESVEWPSLTSGNQKVRTYSH